MEVWVLEWSHPNDNENNITLWANETDARRKAVDEVQDYISNNWDMDDEDQARYSEEIDDLVARGRLKEAVNHFHDYEDNYNEDYAQYWHVYKKEVLTGDGDVSSNPSPNTNHRPYQSSRPGATCRGPCKTFNDYAYADRHDGTYLCRQCSTFQHIFGVKN